MPVTGRILGEHQVAFDVPASSGSLRLLRMSVAERAAVAGFASPDVDRARAVVDELAAVLMEEAQGSRLVVIVTHDEPSLLLEGEVRHTGPVPVVDDIVSTLLDLCVGTDGWSLSATDKTLCFGAEVEPREPR
jgi:hypothetical protein